MGGSAISPRMGTARGRLLRAMVEAVARDGYAGASVASVIASAGVSRASFYQQFLNREDCFRAAYAAIAKRMRRAVVEAASSSEFEERPRAVLSACVAAIAAEPEAGRVLLTEVAGAPEAIRAEREALLEELAEGVEQHFDELDGGIGRQRRPALALIGGVSGVIVARLIGDEAEELDRLVDDLVEWIDCCTRPAIGADLDWDRLGRRIAAGVHFPPTAPAQKLLPRGFGSLGEPSAAAVHQARIVAATSKMTAAKGYARVTVADIVASARVGRGVFYEHFKCKQDAVRRAQDVVLQQTMAAAAPAFFEGRDWPQRVWNVLAALLAYVALNPDEARLVVVEAPAAGEAAVAREYENRMAYARLLREDYEGEGGAWLSGTVVAEAIAGAVYGLVRDRIVKGCARRSLELLPQSTFLVLAPYIGAEAAARFVSLKARQLD